MTDSFFIIMDATMMMMNDESLMTLLMITIMSVTKIQMATGATRTAMMMTMTMTNQRTKLSCL